MLLARAAQHLAPEAEAYAARIVFAQLGVPEADAWNGSTLFG